MDSRLIALKLFLDELEVPEDITTLDNRKRVQKAVYLGQATGASLSYHFGWYLLGPYSPALTKDYYALAEEIASEDRSYEDNKLQDTLVEKIRKVVPLMKIPEDVSLAQEDWLELLSSLHFLRKSRGKDDREAREILRTEKLNLSEFTDQAEEQLKKAGLLS